MKTKIEYTETGKEGVTTEEGEGIFPSIDPEGSIAICDPEGLILYEVPWDRLVRITFEP